MGNSHDGIAASLKAHPEHSTNKYTMQFSLFISENVHPTVQTVNMIHFSITYIFKIVVKNRFAMTSAVFLLGIST